MRNRGYFYVLILLLLAAISAVAAASPVSAAGGRPTATTARDPTATGSPAALTRIQQNNSLLAYSGTWTASTSTLASGGSFRFAKTSGSSVTIHFGGTNLAWIAKKSSIYGKARVTLDRGTPVLVDLYSLAPLWKQTVWTSGTLAYGYHTVKIEWTGLKSTASLGTYINVDAFDIDGTLAAAPTRYQQTDARLCYTGAWTNSNSASASGGSFVFADSARSSVTIKFTGTYLAWIAKKSPLYGKASVSVDGGHPETVNLYSPNTVWQQLVWNTGLLTAGTHTVAIEWTGTKFGRRNRHQRQCRLVRRGGQTGISTTGGRPPLTRAAGGTAGDLQLLRTHAAGQPALAHR